MSDANEWTSIGHTADGDEVFAAPVGTPPPHLGRLRVVPAYAHATAVGRTDSRMPWAHYTEGFADTNATPAIESGPEVSAWVDTHGIVHTEVFGENPYTIDAVRQVYDRIAELARTVRGLLL